MENNNDKNKSGEPRDPRHFVFLIFYFLGVGTLLPWNFFISVSDYWKYKWRTVEEPEVLLAISVSDSSADNSTADSSSGLNEMQLNWPSHLAVASMVPNVTVLLLNAAFGHRFKTTLRLLVSLVMVIILFVFTAAMAQVDTSSWQDTFYVVTLVSVVAINVNAAIFQGGLLGVAGKFPPRYINGVFAGQALGGLFASATNVVFLVLGASQDLAAFLCFVLAVVFLATALLCFAAVTKSKFYQHYVGEGQADEGKEGKEEEEKDSSAPEKEKFVPNGSNDPATPPVHTIVKVSPFTILIKILPYALAIFLCFAVTLGCFPAVTALIVSTEAGLAGSDWANLYFVPVACFLFFNIGDYGGRFIAGKLQWPRPGRVGGVLTLVLTVARVAFIPLFLMCNANPNQEREITPLLIANDYVYMALMLLFSLSNGYLGSICMMSAPQVCLPEEQQTAASLMVALLGLGLGAGSLSSNLFVKLL